MDLLFERSARVVKKEGRQRGSNAVCRVRRDCGYRGLVKIHLEHVQGSDDMFRNGEEM